MMHCRLPHLCTLIAATLTARAADAQQKPAALQLTEVLKIDGANEDIANGSINFRVLPNGRIAVFDGPNARYVFFDSTGKRLGTFGRKGEGPGEFTPSVGNLYAMQVGVIGDTIWTYADRQRRFTLIGPDFTLVRAFTLPQYDASTIVQFRLMSLLPGDRIMGKATYGSRTNVTLANGRSSSQLNVSDSAFVVIASSGAIERRIGSPPPDSSMAIINRPGETYRFAPVPLRASFPTAHSPTGDRFAVATYVQTSATTGDVRLTVVRSTGDTAFSRKYALPLTPVTKRMRDSALARFDSIYSRTPVPGMNEMMEFVRQRVPTVLPPFQGMNIGADGSVWLRKNPSGPEGAEYMVISPSGDVVGTVQFPRKGLILQTATRSTIWATETDADGFVHIVRFRVGAVAPLNDRGRMLR